MPKRTHNEEIVYLGVSEGDLEIDEQGRIWRLGFRLGGGGRHRLSERRRAEFRHPRGYLQIQRRVGKKKVAALAHRIVWFHFHGHIDGQLTITHKNGINSDNRLSNLELATSARHGEAHGGSKLTVRQVREIRECSKRGENQYSIAARYGVCRASVSHIVTGRTWKDLA